MRKFLLVSGVAACAFGIPSFAGAVPSLVNNAAVAANSVPAVRLAQNQGINSPGNIKNGPGGTQAENSQSPCNKNGQIVSPSHPNNGFGNCGSDGIPGNSAGTPGGSQDITR